MQIRISLGALGALVLVTVAARTARAQDAMFTSPSEATQALVTAVKQDDAKQLARILGSDDVLHTENDSADVLERHQFVAKYEEMHRIRREGKGTRILYVGAENWPFPVPLDSTSGGWHFDATRGAQEVLYRRIGENETTAIETCQALVAGTIDVSAVGSPYYGYVFRPLPGNDKAFVAYPAEYKSSGIMTFIVDQQGVVYEKDNGPTSEALAGAMTSYHRDKTWRAVASPD